MSVFAAVQQCALRMKEKSVATKVHVTVKSVEVANARMQLSRAPAHDRPQLSGGNMAVNSAPPSSNVIAQAGQRALQQFKK